MITDFSIPQNLKQLDSVCLSLADSHQVISDSAFQPGARADEGERAPGSADEIRSLGIVTKFASQPEKMGDSGVYERIKRRYELQDVSRKLLPGQRVCMCRRWRFTADQLVGVMYAPKVSRAHYSNLITCGTAWVCPICAAIISERQRGELAKAFDQWKNAGNSVFLVTLTMSHDAGEKLDSLLVAMNNSYRDLKSGRWWKNFVSDFRVSGSVMSHEITYGQYAGFHPHKHVLLFIQGKLSNSEKFALWFMLNNHWQSMLARYDRSCSDEKGVSVQDGDKASDYVAKWGIVEELTKANSKFGRSTGPTKDHFSPFELLQLVETGSSWAGAVFQEYAVATKGLNRLRWSPRLRDLFELGAELTDQEIAEKQEEKAYKLLDIAFPDWKKVLKARARAVLLEVASSGQLHQVHVYLESLGIGGENNG